MRSLASDAAACTTASTIAPPKFVSATTQSASHRSTQFTTTLPQTAGAAFTRRPPEHRPPRRGQARRPRCRPCRRRRRPSCPLGSTATTIRCRSGRFVTRYVSIISNDHRAFSPMSPHLPSQNRAARAPAGPAAPPDSSPASAARCRRVHLQGARRPRGSSAACRAAPPRASR